MSSEFMLINDVISIMNKNTRKNCVLIVYFKKTLVNCSKTIKREPKNF